MTIAIDPVTAADHALLRDLAGRIWRQHYTGMIPAAQIDFMLAERFRDDALHETRAAADRWLELLRVDGEAVGYCGSMLVAAEPESLKLGQLYLLDARRGQGLGRRMLEHVEARARTLGRRTVFLQVNKANAGAIAFYTRRGFTVREAAVFEIGGGFVMDDYIMEKRLG